MPRALLSVYDKRGLVEFARALAGVGYELLSTGGTLRELAGAGLTVTAVESATGFPEILEGRVKTLHPKIHGGILARREEAHLAELTKHDIQLVDVVVSNLYPFERTVAKPDVSYAEALEQIDVGGPAMLRAAAKNHPWVTVVVDPDDYPEVLAGLERGVSAERRRALALKAFEHTAAYDAAIAAWLRRQLAGDAGPAAAAAAANEGSRGASDQAAVVSSGAMPDRLVLSLDKVADLRYGENPHQAGAHYREAPAVGSGALPAGVWDAAKLHSGSALSYLNLFDADAAWSLAFELGAGRSAVIVKHANACGAAVADGVRAAYQRAFEADPKSAFGGVVAVPGEVDDELARLIVANPKADVLIASAYTPGALSLFAAKRKNMRVLEVPPPRGTGLQLRRIDGGFLAQPPDAVESRSDAWRVVSARAPTDAELDDLELAYRVCARTSSNAIVIASGGVAVGVGAGQQSRVDAVEIAAAKAGARAAGAAAASDAFFPFRDGIDALAKAGVACVVQPGGSIRDEEIVAAADSHGMAMLFTGRRHFRH